MDDRHDHRDSRSTPLAALAEQGAVTTFYSYEGGAKRNAVLAAMAHRLAARAGPVLVIDWDLAAPALHDALLPCQAATGPARPGVLELFEACRSMLEGAPRDDGRLAERVLELAAWEDYIEPVAGRRPLYLLRAGRDNDSYARRASQFDWEGLFAACPALVRTFMQQLTRHFAHVLVAAGSGRSAVVSLCTTLVPDRLVGLFTPAPGSLEGLEGVFSRAIEYRCTHEDEQRPLLLYPLPCAGARIPANGYLRWRHGDGIGRHNGYEARLEALMQSSYGWPGIRLHSYFDAVYLDAGAWLAADTAFGQQRVLTRCVAQLGRWLMPGRLAWQSPGGLPAHSPPRLQPRLPPHLPPHSPPHLPPHLPPHAGAAAPRRSGQALTEWGAMGHGEPLAAHDGAADTRAAVLDRLGAQLATLQHLIESRRPREARQLADSLRHTVLRSSTPQRMHRHGAALIKQVYQQDGDQDALLAFTLAEVASLEGALWAATHDHPVPMR